MNTYGYVGGNPNRYIDEYGLSAAIPAPGFPIFFPPVRIPELSDWNDSDTAYLLKKYIRAICVVDQICRSTMLSEAAHPEEEEALNATCDDASWAIPLLKKLIEERKRKYKASGGGRIDVNPTGPGHKKRIKKLEDKLKWLENCPKQCS